MESVAEIVPDATENPVRVFAITALLSRVTEILVAPDPSASP